MRQTCRYYPLLRTTHLVKQDDVGITNLNDANTDIPRGINTALTQSGVRGESPTEPDGTSKTS